MNAYRIGIHYYNAHSVYTNVWATTKFEAIIVALGQTRNDTREDIMNVETAMTTRTAPEPEGAHGASVFT